MKCLVTGATGFVGSWLCRSLVELKNFSEVKALYRKEPDKNFLHQIGCNPFYGDVTQPETLEQAFQDVQVVFHLAGVVGHSSDMRPLMEKVNVQGTKNVLNLAIKYKIDRMVHMSSVVAIGASFSDKNILNENSPYNVAHLHLGYFETKRKAEQMVQESCLQKKIDAVIVNPSTIYGPGDAKKGSRRTQIKVAQGKFPFYTKGGVNVVAVEDVVQGILAALEKGQTGERYILSGENLYIKELFQIIADAAGVPPPPIYLPPLLLRKLAPLGDGLSRLNIKFPINHEMAWTSTLFHWFDASKAKKALNFKPSSSKKAIEKSVQWMKKHLLN